MIGDAENALLDPSPWRPSLSNLPTISSMDGRQTHSCGIGPRILDRSPGAGFSEVLVVFTTEPG